MVPKNPSDEPVSEADKKYLVYSPDGKLVLVTDDIFKGLDKLKAQSPGAKMTRNTDHKTLAYTTAPKPEDQWIFNLQ